MQTRVQRSSGLVDSCVAGRWEKQICDPGLLLDLVPFSSACAMSIEICFVDLSLYKRKEKGGQFCAVRRIRKAK